MLADCWISKFGTIELFRNAQFGIMTIFLPLWFYVKSILKNVEVLSLFGILGALTFVNFSPKIMQNCINIKTQSLYMCFCSIMTDFETLDSPSWISRKIWVTEKSCICHTVKWSFKVDNDNTNTNTPTFSLHPKKQFYASKLDICPNN